MPDPLIGLLTDAELQEAKVEAVRTGDRRLLMLSVECLVLRKAMRILTCMKRGKEPREPTDIEMTRTVGGPGPERVTKLEDRDD